MTEDEIWDAIERKQQRVKSLEEQSHAVLKSVQFIDGLSSAELGIMTLRKAYEIGYRAGAYNEQRKHQSK